MLTPVQRK